MICRLAMRFPTPRESTSTACREGELHLWMSLRVSLWTMYNGDGIHVTYHLSAATTRSLSTLYIF